MPFSTAHERTGSTPSGRASRRRPPVVRRGRDSARPAGRRLLLLSLITTVLVASLVTWWPTQMGTVSTLTASHRAGAGESVADAAASPIRSTRATAGRADRAGRAHVAERSTATPVTRPPGSRSGSRDTAPEPSPADHAEPAVPVPEASGAGTAATAPAPSATAPAPAATAPAPAVTAPAPAVTAPAPAVPAAAPVGRASGGLSGVSFYGPNAGAARAAAQPGVAPEDASLLAELARIPTATWLGQWSGDVASTVRGVVADARAAGAVPVLVPYNIPGRDCGGHSAGGMNSPAAYAAWIQGIADGIGTAEAVVVVEPDALAQLCGDPAARFRMLAAAVEVLERNPGTHTYVDAGHAAWVDAATMADRLRAAGAGGADGFALNVSNFGTTANNVAYGQRLSALLDGARFVVDTSRNGNGPGSDWCNPAGRAVGERPTATTGEAGVDAYLWVKTPGESDGTCNGGPAAGVFWPQYALGLMRAA